MSDAARNQRFRPEVTAALAELKDSLLARSRMRSPFTGQPMLTRENAIAAYADAVKQCIANADCLMVDERAYTRVRCRDCGNTTSVPDRGFSENSKWACRCRPGNPREIFIDAIGDDGAYTLPESATPLLPPAIEIAPFEDQRTGLIHATS